MAQNDTHVALIILTTQMWGGGGGNYWWKKLFRAKICVPAPSAPTSVLTQNKGPDTEPHFSNPRPLLRRASMSPPPPTPQSNFQVAQACCWVRVEITSGYICAFATPTTERVIVNDKDGLAWDAEHCPGSSKSTLAWSPSKPK